MNAIFLITIKSIQGDLEHFIKLDHTNVTVNGESVSGGLNDVINTLNELYTVGAFQSVVISDPYSTMIADVDGVVTKARDFAVDIFSPVEDKPYAEGQVGIRDSYGNVWWIATYQPEKDV